MFTPDNPKRAMIIIETAKIVGFPVDQLGDLVLEALDAPAPDKLFPIYDVMPDSDKTDPRDFLIFFINMMSGSDDDHDYLAHDLDHMTDAVEPCNMHGTPCATCCEPCMND